jgi:hypothetical protein
MSGEDITLGIVISIPILVWWIIHVVVDWERSRYL